MLVSIRSGTAKAPKARTVVLDVALRPIAELEGFGRPFTHRGSRVGGSIDPRNDRLGILDLDTLTVTATDRFAPGIEADGALIGLDADGALMRDGEVLARDLDILAIVPDGFFGRRGRALQRGGEVAWSWEAPAEPRRVAVNGHRVAVAWDEGVAALDARTGREIFVRPDLASAEAGFYETVGTVLDVAVLPNGL
ncbi:MAG: hypothetical protein KC619_05825, partial [Myxococcales bacterium]|nr:hypothetical protein [Myxococcales bacterium]